MADNPNLALNPQTNPLDLPGKKQEIEESELIKGIVETELNMDNEKILGGAPEIDLSLFDEVEAPKSIFLVFLKIIFAILVSFSLFSVFFFTSQFTSEFAFLTDQLGLENLATKLAASNAEIKNLQTDINYFQYLSGKSELDKFSYYGDAYAQNYLVANSLTASAFDKENSKQAMQDLREKIKAAFNESRKIFLAPFTVALVNPDLSEPENPDEVFGMELKNRLDEKAAGIMNKIENAEVHPPFQALNYLHAKELVGNTGLSEILAKTDFDALNEKELVDLIKKVNSVIVNNLSLIQEIKKSRIKWSDIMKEIEVRTIAVDPHFSEDFFDEFGGIRYTSYDFDSAKPGISITGETKRYDTINFTMMVNLIEELNRSAMFKNGEINSFSKSGSPEEGYLSSLKLSLDLETENLVTQ